MFAKYLDESEDEFEAGQKVIDETFGYGGFSAVILARKKSNGETKIISIKDKRAINPMCFGERDDTFFVTSETYPLQNFGIEDIKRVRGGDVVVFSEDGIETRNFGDSELEMPCIFQIIYFGGPEALVLEDLGPMFPELAKRLGRNLKPGHNPSNFTVRNCLGLTWYDYWKDNIPEADLYSPVVDSGKGVTAGIAAGYLISAKKYLESLVKTLAYRTYQMSHEKERWLEILLKNKVITDLVEGIRLFIGDDSIVKGGVSGLSDYKDMSEKSFFPRKNYGVIGQLKNIGKVAEIVMGISYAPMYFQCFNDFSKMKVYAAQGSVGKPLIDVCDDVAKRLEPDWETNRVLKVRYNPLENVYGVCGKGYCAACADGCYPVDERFIPDKIKKRKEIFDNASSDIV